MSNLFVEMENKIKEIISGWREDEIFAISFLVTPNGSYAYRGFNNVSSFHVSYNTEKDCGGAGKFDEERWNYAFWRQDETPVIDPTAPDALTDMLFDWHAENGITNVGYEDPDMDYNERGEYIGKGPVGHYELLTMASDIARKLQNEKFIFSKFRKPIPIIVHGLEYAPYDIEATQNANPNGEAEVFQRACEILGFC